jgi:membrane carboxypeptidase/penicillin-binding protein
MTRAPGASTSVHLWREFMKTGLSKTPVRNFKIPPILKPVFPSTSSHPFNEDQEDQLEALLEKESHQDPRQAFGGWETPSAEKRERKPDDVFEKHSSSIDDLLE